MLVRLTKALVYCIVWLTQAFVYNLRLHSTFAFIGILNKRYLIYGCFTFAVSDVDECAGFLNVCENGGTCINLMGNYTCRCTDGWTGPNCRQGNYSLLFCQKTK